MRLGDTKGRLGVDRIVWRLRMQYADWKQIDTADDDWDGCCTCWVFAISETEARQKVWEKFNPPSVMPVSIASCEAERFVTARDEELERKWAA